MSGRLHPAQLRGMVPKGTYSVRRWTRAEHARVMRGVDANPDNMAPVEDAVAVILAYTASKVMGRAISQREVETALKASHWMAYSFPEVCELALPLEWLPLLPKLQELRAEVIQTLRQHGSPEIREALQRDQDARMQLILSHRSLMAHDPEIAARVRVRAAPFMLLPLAVPVYTRPIVVADLSESDGHTPADCAGALVARFRAAA